MKLPLGAHSFVLDIVHDLASSSAYLQCVEVCADVPPPPPQFAVETSWQRGVDSAPSLWTPTRRTLSP